MNKSTNSAKKEGKLKPGLLSNHLINHRWTNYIHKLTHSQKRRGKGGKLNHAVSTTRLAISADMCCLRNLQASALQHWMYPPWRRGWFVQFFSDRPVGGKGWDSYENLERLQMVASFFGRCAVYFIQKMHEHHVRSLHFLEQRLSRCSQIYKLLYFWWF